MRKDSSFKRILLNSAVMLTLSTAGSAYAANWLMIQGTEPAAASQPVKFWGFLQAQYEKDYSNPNSTSGVYTPPKLLGPNLDSQSGFNIPRARFGARGTPFPLDSKVNYFLMLEMGSGGITAGSNPGPKMTDASVTLNHIPGARIRVGLFKTPGAEEALQAIPVVFDYINFSEATNALLLERSPNRSFRANSLPQTQTQLQNGGSLNAFNAPVGGFRDSGVQVFDAFDLGNDMELSYAAMLGNGNATEFSNYDGEQDKYTYLSLEKKLGGSGAKAEGLKFFTWSQQGKRSLNNNLVANANEINVPRRLFVRDRAGLGVKYRQNQFRATAEIINADGMVFMGPDKPNFALTSHPTTGVITNDSSGANSHARGWYMEGGWYIPNSKFVLDVRYDTLTRLIDRPVQHTFRKWTWGTQYHFNPTTRVTLNYEYRMFACDSGVAACNAVNANLDGVGNKAGLQLTTIF